jgi:hypothetical protein
LGHGQGGLKSAGTRETCQGRQQGWAHAHSKVANVWADAEGGGARPAGRAPTLGFGKQEARSQMLHLALVERAAELGEQAALRHAAGAPPGAGVWGGGAWGESSSCTGAADPASHHMVAASMGRAARGRARMIEWRGVERQTNGGIGGSVTWCVISMVAKLQAAVQVRMSAIGIMAGKTPGMGQSWRGCAAPADSFVWGVRGVRCTPPFEMESDQAKNLVR